MQIAHCGLEKSQALTSTAILLVLCFRLWTEDDEHQTACAAATLTISICEVRLQALYLARGSKTDQEGFLAPATRLMTYRS